MSRTGNTPGSGHLPGWPPIIAAPVIAVLAWFAAYWVAEHRGAPVGDTNFAFMPTFPLFIGAMWLTLAVVILIIRATEPRRLTVLVPGAITNAFGVLAIHGLTFSLVGGDGWPDDGMALAALVVAAIVGLLPIAWLFVPVRERPRRAPTRPRSAPTPPDEEGPGTWW